jgi:hypothetical protein
MRYIYYIDGKKFKTDNYQKIPWFDISSPNENTPAIQELNSEFKIWCKKSRFMHRLNGPAGISPTGTKYFYLNDKGYVDIQTWLKAHPNQDNSFQIEMLLKWS